MVFASILRCVALLVGTSGAIAVAAIPAAGAEQSFVDRRVTALPATSLLHASARTLVDRRRQEAASNFRFANRALFFVWAFSQIVTFFLLWRSGGAARLRDWLKRRIHDVRVLRFAYGVALAAIGGLAAFPASLAQYKLDLVYGLTAESAGGWLQDSILRVSLDALVVGAVVAFIFELVDRTRLWYLYGAAGLFVLTLGLSVLQPIVVAPFFEHVTPLPSTSRLREPLERLERAAGIGDAPIYVSDLSHRSTIANADISGFGVTRRVTLGDTLIAVATPGEVLFMTAREFGHYLHGDDLREPVVGTFLFILCTAAAVGVADRLRVRRDDDPLARLALVGALLGLFALAAFPVFNAYERQIESRADKYAWRLTGNRAAAVRAFVRFADESLTPVCPSRASVFYFYSHPPFGERIAAAQGRANPCR